MTSNSVEKADTLRWNTRYATGDYVFGIAPNAFLEAQAHRLKAGMQALAVADGEGRNGVWLARQGLDVTSLDWSARGLAKARAFASRHGVEFLAGGGRTDRGAAGGVGGWSRNSTRSTPSARPPRRSLPASGTRGGSR